jgi:NADH-quinone oxidoreductase subunit G
MLADEMGTPIQLPTVATAAQEFASLGAWEKRAEFKAMPAGKVSIGSDEALLNSWRLLLDAGSLQDGESNLAGTAHPSVAVISKSRAAKLGAADGDLVRISTKLGSITLPCQIGDIEESSIWIPRNSIESRVIATLGAVTGPVMVVKA